MKKRTFLLLFLAALMQMAWAQQNTVESIGKRYKAIKDYIATHTGDDQYDGADWGQYHHLTTRQWLPGTGGHVEDIYLYWDEVETNEDLIYPPHWLTFATTRFNYAARRFYQEYLYDADGSVAFIYAYDPSTAFGEDDVYKEYELRFYLNKGRVVKAIIKCKDEPDQPYKDEWQGSALPAKYRSALDQYLEKASSLRELFNSTEKATYEREDGD